MDAHSAFGLIGLPEHFIVRDHEIEIMTFQGDVYFDVRVFFRIDPVLKSIFDERYEHERSYLFAREMAGGLVADMYGIPQPYFLQFYVVGYVIDLLIEVY